MKKEWVHLINPAYLGIKNSLEKQYGLGSRGLRKSGKPYAIHDIHTYNGEGSRVITAEYHTDNSELKGKIITEISQEDIKKILRAKGQSITNTTAREAISQDAIQNAIYRGLELLKNTMNNTYSIDTNMIVKFESYSNKTHIPINPQDVYIVFDSTGKLMEDKEQSKPPKEISVSLGFSVQPSESLDDILCNKK